ncbi:hypothetical protein SZ25_00571 [Candidatus Arcanobacter lacustris]|uniref:HTH cro/C1-type domain-containing protein n=1 Tax=Candidatus Arcanibacter lacustris TaxID=1607817 RepID=A0A0F5MNE0_9RICK|nr:hypothetical protein SZ25_00571 [Candidatus Arcanobacter lacustris]
MDILTALCNLDGILRERGLKYDDLIAMGLDESKLDKLINANKMAVLPEVADILECNIYSLLNHRAS